MVDEVEENLDLGEGEWIDACAAYCLTTQTHHQSLDGCGEPFHGLCGLLVTHVPSWRSRMCHRSHCPGAVLVDMLILP